MDPWGGQVCPRGLHEYESKSGKLRELINRFYKINPLYKKKVSQFSKVYVCNLETQEYIPDSEVLIDVPLNDEFRSLKIVATKKDNESDPIRILFAGRLIQKKGISILIDALKYIDKNLNYKILIYGEGKEEVNIRGKVKNLRLEDKVHFMGKVPYEKMSNVYSEADIFVMPSIRESGGSVLVEAMSHKLPIVALDMSLSHFLNEKRCGLFVNPDQSKENILKDYARCLTELANNTELRVTCGENGYRFVNEQLNWDIMMKKVYGFKKCEMIDLESRH